MTTFNQTFQQICYKSHFTRKKLSFFILQILFFYQIIISLRLSLKTKLKTTISIMDNTQIVGEKIKSIRETKQISVSELAERTGLAE